MYRVCVIQNPEGRFYIEISEAVGTHVRQLENHLERLKGVSVTSVQ